MAELDANMMDRLRPQGRPGYPQGIPVYIVCREAGQVDLLGTGIVLHP